MGDTTDGHPLNTSTEIGADYDNLQPVLDEIATFATMAFVVEHVFDGDHGALAGAGQSWHEQVDAAFADYRGMPSPSGFDWELAEVVYSAEQIDITPGTPGTPGAPGGGGTSPASNSAAGAPLATTLVALIGRASQLQGATAETFFDGYVAGLPVNIGNIHWATVGLGVALAAEQQLWTRARANVVRIAQDADIAMEVATPDDGGGLSTGLLIGGALLLAVSTVATAGAADVAIAAGLAGIGATTASTLVDQASPEGTATVPLGADNPEQVLINVSSALDQVRSDVAKQEAEIAAFIDSVLSAVRDDANFDLTSPDLLRDDRSSHVLDRRQILLSDHEVHNITDRWLPDVADALLRSGSTRDEPSQGHWDRTGGLGTGPSGPFASYTGLHHAIKARADNTAGELTQSALHLRTAYAGITGVDRHADQDLGSQTRRLGLEPLG